METTKVRGSTNQGRPAETQTPIQKLNELLAEMDIKIDKAARTASSKQEEIEEYCSSLRCKVDAHSETMIEEIRKWNEKMRNEINDYERQCLEQFNAEEFKASSDLVKSRLSEMNDLQSRIRQQLVDAQSDAERINDLIAEASSKLVELKKLDFRMKKLKFTESMPNYYGGKKEFDPSNGARLVPTNMVSRDRMIQVSTISNMKGFKSLKNCFINPFASPHELIALVENQSDQMIFVKMDLDGKILMQKRTENYYRVSIFQTIKKGFIFEVYNRKDETSLKYFDYDLNEIKHIQGRGKGDLHSSFTANQSLVIKPFEVMKKEDHFFTFTSTKLRFIRHDSTSEILPTMKCACDDGHFESCLATDKYLFLWYKIYERDHDCLQVFDIEHLKVNQKKTGEESCSDNRPKYIDSLDVSRFYSFNLKVYGDKYIARYLRGSLMLYTQDSKFQLVQEYKVDLLNDSGYYEMSQDCSNGLCFFNRDTGEICHNLI